MRRRALAALVLGASGWAVARAVARPSGSLARLLDGAPLRVGLWPGTPPWAWRDAAGAPTGMDVELARLLAEDLGTVAEVVALAPEERVPALESGRVDLLGAAALHPAALARLSFARPHDAAATTLALRAGLAVAGPGDLVGRRVAVPPAGAPPADAVRALLPPGVRLVEMPDWMAGLRALAGAEVEAAVAYDWVLHRALAQGARGIVAGFDLRGWRIGMALRPEDQDLLHVVNVMLGLRDADGSLDEMRQRHRALAMAG